MSKEKKPSSIKAVHIVTTCQRCGESTELYLTKQQLLKMLKKLKQKPTEIQTMNPQDVTEIKEGDYW